MEQRHLTRGKILLAYVKSRRSGTTAAEALEKIKSDAVVLSAEDRHLLSNDIKQWENEQSKQPGAPTAPKSPIQPLTAPPPGREQTSTASLTSFWQNEGHSWDWQNRIVYLPKSA